METIQALTQVNYLATFISIFTILFGLKIASGLLEWFFNKLGLETKWMRNKREEHNLLIQTSKGLSILQAKYEELQTKHEESVKQSIAHDETIKESVNILSKKVDTISDAINEMRNIQAKDKLAEYKDRIGQSYRLYNSRKYSEDEQVPYWNHMEKEALEGLIEQYEVHGGKNSFVHSVVEVEMQKWKVVE